ncbi:hypothetical protein F5B20DRAFT_503832 [Whalleya microplaca]|nr:hypothetical protein F5B20DRAFT_503832 [Whalleya microplaca]
MSGCSTCCVLLLWGPGHDDHDHDRDAHVTRSAAISCQPNVATTHTQQMDSIISFRSHTSIIVRYGFKLNIGRERVINTRDNFLHSPTILLSYTLVGCDDRLQMLTINGRLKIPFRPHQLVSTPPSLPASTTIAIFRDVMQVRPRRTAPSQYSVVPGDRHGARRTEEREHSMAGQKQSFLNPS